MAEEIFNFDDLGVDGGGRMRGRYACGAGGGTYGGGGSDSPESRGLRWVCGGGGGGGLSEREGVDILSNSL